MVQSVATSKAFVYRPIRKPERLPVPTSIAGGFAPYQPTPSSSDLAQLYYSSSFQAATAPLAPASSPLQLPPGLMTSPPEMLTVPNQAELDSIQARMARIDAELAAKLEELRPPTVDEIKAMLADGKLTPAEAAKMELAEDSTKLAMLESWGLKPKHTNKDPQGAMAIFSQVVGAMVKGPAGKQKLKYAGAKFKMHIKLGPNGELTAGFKRKKPSFLKKLLKVVIKVVGVVASVVGSLVGGVGALIGRAISMAASFVKV